MAQLSLNKAQVTMARTETVKISGSLLAQRIQQFSLTLIGRLKNPSVQRMESLVANMPKIWKLEERVVGTDLGLGKFQFNFENEEDLLGVLQHVSYHFDGYMVYLVRWETIIDSSYPSAINFWVKITEIPLHFWEESTIRDVGKVIGVIREIDADSGSVYVTVNGFNPLLFKVVVPFDIGDEIVVSLEYEKLCGVCRHCSRLTDDVAVCPELRRNAGMSHEEHQDGRFIMGSSSNAQLQDGQWEKPRKIVAKRALEFSESDPRDGFPYKKDIGDHSRHYSRRNEKYQGLTWAKKTGAKGTNGENGLRYGQKLIHKLTIPLEVNQVVENEMVQPVVGTQEDNTGVVLALQPGAEIASIEGATLEDGELAGMTSDVLGNMVEPDSMYIVDTAETADTGGNINDYVSFSKDIMDVNQALSGISLGPKKVTGQLVRSPRIKGLHYMKKNVILASHVKRLKANVLKQKYVGSVSQRAKGGKSAGAVKGIKKSGMVALPDPPANT
ncbi:hypothetical protein V5N11_022564 [Cardamine amara subsp. amara]|uniref:DUF4283 domain-containing protein n=1 Tax=Cardamine amara subsp. amara TaxID=228776 RepID=A0ABD1A2L8_CARAN